MRNFFDKYGAFLFFGVIVAFFATFLFFALFEPSLNEGMVMNKWISPAEKTCTDGDCVYKSTRYIVAVQDGDKKDWWYVTENFYDNVNIGEWVKK